MNNAEIVQHNGKEVLVMNIADIPAMEVIKRIKAIEEKIVDFPLGSVYLLVMTTKLAYNSITSSNLNDFSQLFGKYIKASVIVDESLNMENAPASSADGGPKRSKIFSEKETALDWITSQ